jgi:hypothetical protein
MSENHQPNSQNHGSHSRHAPWPLGGIAGAGGRAASTALRPLAGAMGAAAEAGVNFERRAVDRVLDSDELGRVLNAAIDNQHVQAAVQRALAGDGATRLLDSLFDSGLIDRFMGRLFDSGAVDHLMARLFESGAVDHLMAQLFESGAIDRFLERLLAGEGLWHVVDEVAASPAVTAAISQQGLGFADQVGEEVRTRSRNADDWIERAARRLARRAPKGLPEPEQGV